MSGCVFVWGGGGIGIVFSSSGRLGQWPHHLLVMSSSWCHHVCPHSSSNKCCCLLLPNLFGLSQEGQAASAGFSSGKWQGWGESSPAIFWWCPACPGLLCLGREEESMFSLPARRDKCTSQNIDKQSSCSAGSKGLYWLSAFRGLTLNKRDWLTEYNSFKKNHWTTAPKKCHTSKKKKYTYVFCFTVTSEAVTCLWHALVSWLEDC